MGNDRPRAAGLEQEISDADVDSGIWLYGAVPGPRRIGRTAFARTFAALLFALALALERTQRRQLDRLDRAVTAADGLDRVQGSGG